MGLTKQLRNLRVHITNLYAPDPQSRLSHIPQELIAHYIARMVMYPFVLRGRYDDYWLWKHRPPHHSYLQMLKYNILLMIREYVCGWRNINNTAMAWHKKYRPNYYLNDMLAGQNIKGFVQAENLWGFLQRDNHNYAINYIGIHGSRCWHNGWKCGDGIIEHDDEVYVYRMCQRGIKFMNTSPLVDTASPPPMYFDSPYEYARIIWCSIDSKPHRVKYLWIWNGDRELAIVTYNLPVHNEHTIRTIEYRTWRRAPKFVYADTNGMIGQYSNGQCIPAASA